MTAYNNHITETRLKKFYSLFNQAIRLSISDNGEPEGWTEYWEPSSNTYDEEGNLVHKPEGITNGFSMYLLPYLKISHTKTIKNRIFYYLADGSSFSFSDIQNRDIMFFPKDAEKCLQSGLGINKLSGICAFQFIFYPIHEHVDWKWHYKKGLEPTLYKWNGTREHLYSGGDYSCANNGYYCTAIIKQNGWKIPKDYPRKIRY